MGAPWRPPSTRGPIEAPAGSSGGPWRPLEAPRGLWRPACGGLKIFLIQETEIKLVLHFQFR